MRWIGLLAILLVAQSTPAATVTLTWAPGLTIPTANASGYQVYRAICNGTVTNGVCSNEGAFVLLATLAMPASGTSLIYDDTTGVSGTSYSYYVITLCSTCTSSCNTGGTPVGSSSPSNHIAVTIP